MIHLANITNKDVLKVVAKWSQWVHYPAVCQMNNSCCEDTIDAPR